VIRALVEIPTPAPERLTVSGERFHHLARVLRVEPGDPVEVFDGRGRAFAAKVEHVGEDSLELALGAERSDSGAARSITIVQGLPKGDKLEWIVEKATELGATAVAPVETTRAVVKLDAARGEKKRERWQRIAEEAARQCRRADVPEVLSPKPLLEAIGELPPGTRVLVLDEEERAVRLGEALDAIDATTPIALVIGPEGGLARDEVDALVRRGAVAVTLGRNVLRTETAALAALSVMRYRDRLLG
jgi:16S rRNA (uracil1498-N3)-methyltransferase